jgi:hypothetical protein
MADREKQNRGGARGGSEAVVVLRRGLPGSRCETYARDGMGRSPSDDSRAALS